MSSSYLLVNQLRYHYLYWNVRGKGQPLVLLHGLASNARIWELTAPYLAEDGFVIYAPDLRGHGLSDKPNGDYGFEVLTTDLAAFLEQLELERPLLVGHSWGAMIALAYASRFRMGKYAPRGVVLVDGGMTQLDDSGLGWEEIRQRLTPPRLAGMPLKTFLELLNSRHRGWQPHPEAVEIILANFEISADETIYPRLRFEHHMQIIRAMWDFKTYECFARLNCAVLLLPARPPAPRNPEEDEFLRLKERGLKQAQRLLRQGQVQWLEDTIHDVPLQRPRQLAALIANFAQSLR